MAAARARLFVKDALYAQAHIALDGAQAHYVRDVMRCGAGDALALFNGRDGEWHAAVADISKKRMALTVQQQLRPQKAGPDLWLAFAPIKHGRIEFLVEKATELGVSVLQPVITHHTVARRVNIERLESHAIEAAEQCGRLDVPEVRHPCTLDALLSAWPAGRTLIYGDESGQGAPVKSLLPALSGDQHGVIIGPEGGFSRGEHALLRRQKNAAALCMGPRVMRADTAALAALACVQAWLGDWDQLPDFRQAQGA